MKHPNPPLRTFLTFQLLNKLKTLAATLPPLEDDSLRDRKPLRFLANWTSPCPIALVSLRSSSWRNDRLGGGGKCFGQVLDSVDGSITSRNISIIPLLWWLICNPRKSNIDTLMLDVPTSFPKNRFFTVYGNRFNWMLLLVKRAALYVLCTAKFSEESSSTLFYI